MPSPSSRRELGGLVSTELFFRDHQVWLEERGYMLRSRYKPDWVPSWRGTNKLPINCFDGEATLGWTLDAVRIRDNVDVALKRLLRSQHVPPGDDTGAKYEELEIGKFFSSSPLREDPRNHCVPIFEVLEVPDVEDLVEDCQVIVMPLLRTFDSRRFDTFGEAVDFFDQAFEGLKFMHDNNVAHRDCTVDNIMMDPSQMYPDGYHPAEPNLSRNYSGRARFHTRTQRPPKYYWTDFGLSRKYTTRNPPPLEDPIHGGDKTVPEHQGESPESCDPFPTDIYYLGNLIRDHFVEGNEFQFSPKLRGFEFMKPLVDSMVADDPAQRPTIDEVIARFKDIKAGLSSWKLRSRVVKDDDFPFPLFRSIGHWTRRVSSIARRIPAIPRRRLP
ncbi:hypothetical protein C8R46DRAFT_1164465 [Mycena filopes]|nr:hypothetical protein C8R46DRAFT_1164465 [Mycena filopes]